MHDVLTGQQMKDCDRRTIREFGVPSPVLMERAALACVEELLQLSFWDWGERNHQPRILILCGSGNNGGDGIAVGRILLERGICPLLHMAGGCDRLSADCSLQLSIARKYGMEEIDRRQALSMLSEDRADIVVDALFGVGLSRDLEEPFTSLVRAVNASRAKVLAVDIPSGIHADTGQCMGEAVRADVTVTFGFYKRGQLLYPGRQYCGVCRVRNIGITKAALAEDLIPCICYDSSDLRRLPARSADSNKGDCGKVLLVAGSKKICGAAYLCGMAAYKTGAGLVRLFTEVTNRTALQQMLPEALLTFYSEEEPKESGGGSPAAELGEAMAWSTVVGIGPGLGTEETAKKLLERALCGQEKPVVMDADALNLLAKAPELLRERQERLREGEDHGKEKLPPLIFTPHMGEMSRLTGVSIGKLKEDPLGYAAALAQKYGAVCVLKDACTVVCDHRGNSFLNTSGNSGMSTGGSGDVLTGVICGLLAQGMEPFEAAALGVYLHGCAGDAAAEKTGEYGLIAGNLIRGIEELTHEQ